MIPLPGFFSTSVCGRVRLRLRSRQLLSELVCTLPRQHAGACRFVLIDRARPATTIQVGGERL